MVANSELLDRIAKMIVDGTISLVPSPIHSSFTLA